MRQKFDFQLFWILASWATIIVIFILVKTCMVQLSKNMPDMEQIGHFSTFFNFDLIGHYSCSNHTQNNSIATHMLCYWKSIPDMGKFGRFSTFLNLTSWDTTGEIPRVLSLFLQKKWFKSPLTINFWQNNEKNYVLK